MPTTYYLNALPIGANVPGNPTLGNDANAGTSPSTPWRTVAHAQTVAGANYANVMVMYPDGVFRTIAPIWNNVMSYYVGVIGQDYQALIWDIYNAFGQGVTQGNALWQTNGINFTGRTGGYFKFGAVASGTLTYISILVAATHGAGPPNPLFSVDGNLHGSSDVISAVVPNSNGMVEWNFGNNTTGQLTAAIPQSLVGQPHVWGFSVKPSYQAIYLDGSILASRNGTTQTSTGSPGDLWLGSAGTLYQGTMQGMLFYWNDQNLTDANFQTLSTWLTGTEIPRLPNNNVNIVPKSVSLPPMGCDIWRLFKNTATETNVKAQADAFVTQGLGALGYNQIVNCVPIWSGTRAGNNNPNENTTAFPSGVAATATYLGTKGLGWSGYYGPMPLGQNCDVVPGSGFEAVDMTYMLGWTNLKSVFLDQSCSDAFLNSALASQYDLRAMGMQAAANGVIMFSAPPPILKYRSSMMDYCPLTGTTIPWTGQDLGLPTFATMNQNLDASAAYGWHLYLSKGVFQYLDIIGAGGGSTANNPTVGMSDIEGQASFTLACILGACLFLVCDLTNNAGGLVGSYTANTFAATMATIKNSEAIAINQDTLLSPAHRVQHQPTADGNFLDIWVRQVTTGACAVLFNRSGQTQTMTLDIDNQVGGTLGIAGYTGYYNIRDLWAHTTTKNQKNPYVVNVPSHAAVMLLINPVSTVATGTGYFIVVDRSNAYTVLNLQSGVDYGYLLQAIIQGPYGNIFTAQTALVNGNFWPVI